MDRYRGSPLPRDRPPIRDRDNHPDVEYFGQGESYRPGGQTGDGPYRPNRDRGPDTWNSDRRDDRRREEIDSYIPPTSNRASRPRSRSPNGFRRRSRSPYGSGKELFPERARSPPRRYSPRRDDRGRSPPRRRSRSPTYNRTPDSRRNRDFSADARRSPRRDRPSSPPRGRFDRPRSPPRRGYSPPRDSNRNNYRPRSRTPPRGGGRSTYSDDNWRRRSPSPRVSGPASNATSRRSSPPVHVDRNSLAGSIPRSPAHQSRYDTKQDSLSYRQRSPAPPHDTSRDRSPPVARDPTAPPTGPASQRASYDRPLPTGPARSFAGAAASPPTGPASQVSMSAHNRGPTSPAIPTQPRGAGAPRFTNVQRDFSNPALRGRGSLTYRAPGLRTSTYPDSGPPAGPRASTYSAPRGDFGAGRGSYSGYGRGDHSYSTSFRPSGNATSGTYPRTQRFDSNPVNTVQAHLSTLEKIVPGGKKLPSGLNPDVERRLQSLNADAEKLRSTIEEKQRSKREAVNEWEVRQRESERETLRSELAEQALSKLMDNDDTGGGAAF